MDDSVATVGGLLGIAMARKPPQQWPTNRLPPGTLAPTAIAKRWSVSTAVIYKWIRDGLLKAENYTSNRLCVTKRRVLAFEKRHGIKPKGAPRGGR